MSLTALADRLERISVAYAEREGFERDDDWFLLKLAEGPQARRGPAASRSGVVGRVWGEIADVLGHILLFARRHGVDPDAALERKWLRWERRA